MIANYGYEDASGTYYITIDTGRCVDCNSHDCLDACPSGIYELQEDDYGDLVIAVKNEMRHQLFSLCSGCKPLHGTNRPLPCQAACLKGAITHTW